MHLSKQPTSMSVMDVKCFPLNDLLLWLAKVRVKVTDFILCSVYSRKWIESLVFKLHEVGDHHHIIV